MKQILTVVLTCFAIGFIGTHILHKIEMAQYTTTYTAPYYSTHGEKEPDDVQCPIPMTDRVKNHTGIQCVYSSIEMLGRWAEEPKLMNPPLTSRSDCKGYSGPGQAATILRKIDVKFEQSYQNRSQGVALIKKAMSEGRGCLFGVPGHAMVLIHYDDQENIVKYVDNSDYSLKVQTMTMDRFNHRWDSWVMVIYADNDVIPYKIGTWILNIPIYDMEGQQREYPRNYIPRPSRKAA